MEAIMAIHVVDVVLLHALHVCNLMITYMLLSLVPSRLAREVTRATFWTQNVRRYYQ